MILDIGEEPKMKIGKLDLGLGLVLAPIAGITGLPFRLLAKRHGADLVFTEMISAAALVQNPQKSSAHILTSEEERPVAAQIFGADPVQMAKSAEMLSGKAVDIIDINMGCPVRKVLKSGSGAALLRDRKRAVEIIRAVVKATPLPVTVKIRSGWDEATICAADFARSAEDAGAAAITLHPRTKVQGFGGCADWGRIREVKEAVTIPVVGNGDVKTPEDAKRMLEQTGCDGVMVGRGALGDPWIFERIRLFFRSGESAMRPGPNRIGHTLLEHLGMEVGLKGEASGVLRMRKFAAWYSKGLPGSADFRNRINRTVTAQEFQHAVESFFFQRAQRSGGAEPLHQGKRQAYAP